MTRNMLGVVIVIFVVLACKRALGRFDLIFLLASFYVL